MIQELKDIRTKVIHLSSVLMQLNKRISDLERRVDLLKLGKYSCDLCAQIKQDLYQQILKSEDDLK